MTREISSAVAACSNNSRDVVANKLAREQIAEAQKLAREWQPMARAQLGGGTS
jgi:hypothetical protein